jgi:CubicO group peptidase (beta-lactamase class C family)
MTSSVAASADPQRAWTTRDWYTLVGEGDPVGRTLGEYAYNNLNYIVLGDLIEVTTEATYAAAIRHDLLDRAAWSGSGCRPTSNPKPPVAVGVDDPDAPLEDWLLTSLAQALHDAWAG